MALYTLSKGEDFFSRLQQLAERPVLVDFNAPWCAPCRMLAPLLERLASEYRDDIHILMVDVEQSDNLSNVLGIRQLPTLAGYQNSGWIWRLSGVISEKELRSHLLTMLSYKREGNCSEWQSLSYEDLVGLISEPDNNHQQLVPRIEHWLESDPGNDQVQALAQRLEALPDSVRRHPEIQHLLIHLLLHYQPSGDVSSLEENWLNQPTPENTALLVKAMAASSGAEAAASWLLSQLQSGVLMARDVTSLMATLLDSLEDRPLANRIRRQFVTFV